MTAFAMDAKVKDIKRSKYWKEKGYKFDPNHMTAFSMDAQVSQIEAAQAGTSGKETLDERRARLSVSRICTFKDEYKPTTTSFSISGSSTSTRFNKRVCSFARISFRSRPWRLPRSTCCAVRYREARKFQAPIHHHILGDFYWLRSELRHRLRGGIWCDRLR